MSERGRKRNIIVTVFIFLLILAIGKAMLTDATQPEKASPKHLKRSSGQGGQKKMLSAKKAEYKLTDKCEADGTNEPYSIYYEDETRMIFAISSGLFVYSREKEEIVQSLDLREIGCATAKKNPHCEIDISEDGKTAYLHITNDNKMYQYSIDTNTLQYLDYKLPDKLYDRKKWEKTHQSGIQCIRCTTIGDLVYYYEDGTMITYEPLFYKPYGSCDFFKPEDIKDLSEVSFYADGKEYVITEKKKLRWIEKHFSNSAKETVASACPFYRIMYLKRQDGRCGKLFPATDSCPVYQSGKFFYDYNEKTNKAFWELFGIKSMNRIR